MADDSIRRKKGRLEWLAEELFLILPALHRRDIAARLGKEIGEYLTLKQVDQLLYWIRKHSKYLGWTVHYAPHSKNETGIENRFIVILNHRDGTFQTELEKHSCLEGQLVAMQSSMTIAAQQSDMLRAQALHIERRSIARKVLEQADTLAFASRRIESLIEDLRDGTA